MPLILFMWILSLGFATSTMLIILLNGEFYASNR
jgi:hypothetical protein